MFMRYFRILSLERAAVNAALRGGEPHWTFKTRSFSVAGKGGPGPGAGWRPIPSQVTDNLLLWLQIQAQEAPGASGHRLGGPHGEFQVIAFINR